MPPSVRILDRRGTTRSEPAPDAGTVVVVIDVIRAFTTAAIGAARGLASIDCTADLATALGHAGQMPDAVLFAEDEAQPEATLGLGNSPRRAACAELAGRRAVLCSTNGTPALAAAPAGALAAAGVNLSATASWVATHRPGAPVELWCTDADGDEDRACAEVLAGLLVGCSIDVERCRRAVEHGANQHLVRWGSRVSAAMRTDFLADALLCAEIDRWPVVLRSAGTVGRTVRLVPERPTPAQGLS